MDPRAPDLGPEDPFDGDQQLRDLLQPFASPFADESPEDASETNIEALQEPPETLKTWAQGIFRRENPKADVNSPLIEFFGRNPFVTVRDPQLDDLFGHICVLKIYRPENLVAEGLQEMSCKSCKLKGTLCRDGTDYNVRMVHGVGTIHVFLVLRYKCNSCRAKVTNLDDHIHQQVCQKAPYAARTSGCSFTKRCGIALDVLQRMENLVRETNAGTEAIARALRAEILDEVVRRRTEILSYLEQRCKQFPLYGDTARELVSKLRAVLGSRDDPLPMLPSTSYLREIVNRVLAQRLEWQERLLASGEPRADGIIAIDLQHVDSSKIMVSSGRSGAKGRPCTAVLNVLNAFNEPLLSVALETKSNEDIKGPLMAMKQNIEKIGGDQPRIVYVDDLSMESLLKEVWPGIDVKLDVFHAMHRSSKLIHINHCQKWDFVLELSACLLVPYDKDVGAFEAARKAVKSKTDLPENMVWAKPGFRKAFDNAGGRWTTPTEEAQAQNLEKLQSRWLEKDNKPGGGTYCDIAKAKLWSDELKESLDRLILLVRCGYLTDPLSAVDMYYAGSNGNLLCKRGTNGVESLHRTQHNAFVGTTMKPETWHGILVNNNARRLTTVRPNVSGDYKLYPTTSHDVLNANNLAMQSLRNRIGRNKSGLDIVFEGLSVPHRNITAEDFVGGTKNKSLAQRAEEEEAAAAAAPFLDQPRAAIATATAPPTAQGKDAAANGSEAPDATQIEASSSPFRKQHSRTAAEGVNRAVQAERGTKRPRQEAATPKKSLKKPSSGFSPKHPVSMYLPPSADVPEHREALRSLLDQPPFRNKKALTPADFTEMAMKWNELKDKKHKDHVETALVYTNCTMLRQFYEKVHLTRQAKTLSWHPELRAEDAGPSEARAESNSGSTNPSTLRQAADAGKKFLQKTLNFSGMLSTSTTVVASNEEKRRGRGGPGQKRYCCACAWKKKLLVNKGGHMKCPHMEEFKKQGYSSEKSSRFVKTLLEAKAPFW